MQKTGYYSWKSGKLAKGCQFCVKGQKLVLFVTGICPRNCFYCPISEKKWKRDVVHADEWPVKGNREIIQEAKLIRAKGAGFTGGDPLAKIGRTVKYIRLLKKTFGKKFHIHLYTSLDLADDEKLEKLYSAGLDEIRIHPDIYNSKLWEKMNLVCKYDWDVGVEIPAIPNAKKQTEKLVEFFKDKIDFLNINELEIADSEAQNLLGTFVPKDRISYGVKGSEELAKGILKKYEGKVKNMHYCTTKLKNKVQLGARLKRRARNVRKPFDYVTREGLLVRGAIYSGSAKKLNTIKNYLIKKHKIPKNLIEIDRRKKRLLTTTGVIDAFKKDLKEKGFKPAVVTEYPTWDMFPVEIDYL